MQNPIDWGEVDPGATFQDKFLNYVKERALKFHIISPLVLPAELQRGDNCKLKALADAALHIATVSNGRVDGPRLYKAKGGGISLREYAKIYGSVVGEVYSLDTLRTVCEAAGFDSDAYMADEAEIYLAKLVELIEQNKAPIVFFDLDLTTYRPYIGRGENEHAAVIAAYYKDGANKTRFIVTQWNNYYDYDGLELAQSSLSLPNKREAETFTKCLDTRHNHHAWVKNKRAEHLEIEGLPKRTAAEMLDGELPLKGKIMVVKAPSEAPSLMSAVEVLGIFAHNKILSRSLDNSVTENSLNPGKIMA